jgi:hypothetical protein
MKNRRRSKEEKEKGVLVISFLLHTMRSSIAKWVIKTAIAPTIKLFIEAKKGFTSEVKP